MTDVTIYYLEMNHPNELNGVSQPADIQVMEAQIANFKLNKFLYQLVGESWQWFDKANLSDSEWQAYAEGANLRTFVAYVKGSIAGYFELKNHQDGSVEIAYLGLVPDFIGQGFGGYLVTEAIQQAWQIAGTKRVCLNTCSLDHPAALKNYQSRGFKLYKQSLRKSA